MAKVEEYWGGSPITECNICKEKIEEEFIDGQTGVGPWALMCPTCYREFGIGLGLGLGQRYHRRVDEDGESRFIKVEG